MIHGQTSIKSLSKAYCVSYPSYSPELIKVLLKFRLVQKKYTSKCINTQVRSLKFIFTPILFSTNMNLRYFKHFDANENYIIPILI